MVARVTWKWNLACSAPTISEVLMGRMPWERSHAAYSGNSCTAVALVLSCMGEPMKET